MTTETAPAQRDEARPGRKEEWAPRIWQGCDFFAWMRLLIRHQFAVAPSFWYIAAIATVVSFFNTLLGWLQQAIYGRKIARTVIREQPIFVIGHWRTGTTYLHELLILDERHAFPTTYECFEPNHFLLTERWLTRWMRFLMPSRRPMDNMRAGWDRPQEDEFALCLMGQPSPYLTIAFPNHPPDYAAYLDLEGVPARSLAAWKKAYYRYLQTLTYKKSGRLILKDPPHTCRIRVLLELFPEARFVHIMRNPYIVFPSTVNLWKSLYRTHGLQRPTNAGLEEYVFSTFTRLYDRLEETRTLVPAARFFEMRYEELIRDPVGQLEALYTHFELDGFKAYQQRLQEYLAQSAGYETNRYKLSPELRQQITERWGNVIRRYGYEGDTAT